MNVKKRLESRIRGWLPKESILKTPLKAQIAPVNRSLSFKVRRWLHGASAFITSLWCQRSQRFKMQAVFVGVFVFCDFFLYFLVTSNSVNFVWYNFGLLILFFSFFTLQWLISVYSKRKEPYKNHLNINPNLRLGSMIIGVFAGAILVYSYYLTSYVYSTPANPSTMPFYLDIAALLMFLLGFGLDMEWRKQNKLEPFQE